MIELFCICQNNEGEAFGLPVSNFLTLGEKYALRNIKHGGLYNEPIAEVYDAFGNRVQVNEGVPFWKIAERFVPLHQIFLN
jgi:hypothetical protein